MVEMCFVDIFAHFGHAFSKKTLKIFAVQRLGHFDNIKLLSVVFDPSIDIRVVN